MKVLLPVSCLLSITTILSAKPVVDNPECLAFRLNAVGASSGKPSKKKKVDQVFRFWGPMATVVHWQTQSEEAEYYNLKFGHQKALF